MPPGHDVIVVLWQKSSARHIAVYLQEYLSTHHLTWQRQMWCVQQQQHMMLDDAFEELPHQ